MTDEGYLYMHRMNNSHTLCLKWVATVNIIKAFKHVVVGLTPISGHEPKSFGVYISMGKQCVNNVNNDKHQWKLCEWCGSWVWF